MGLENKVKNVYRIDTWCIIGKSLASRGMKKANVNNPNTPRYEPKPTSKVMESRKEERRNIVYLNIPKV
jgi:hypothetical protein